MVKQAHPNFVVRRIQVIWHGPNRWAPRSDLLILGTGLRDPSHDMLIADMSLTPDEAMHGWMTFAGKNADAIARQDTMLTRFNPAEVARAACAQLLVTQPFKVLVMEAPAMETTSLVPNSSLKVFNGDSGEISTVGMIAKRGSALGVTAALHAVQDSSGVSVDGTNAVIVSQDVVSDSAFIIPDNPFALTGVAGSPLAGLVPRMFESVSFNGVTSGFTPGQIKGVDPRLPFVFEEGAARCHDGPHHGERRLRCGSDRRRRKRSWIRA